jgi:uncharacterized membrane protein YgcG
MAKDMTADSLDAASQLIDLQARFATYRAALEEGINREDAAALALDSSLNMTRRGELAPYLDVMSFFYSPTAEGLRKLLVQGRYSTIARKVFTRVVVGGALLYLFNSFGPGAGDDDDDGEGEDGEGEDGFGGYSGGGGSAAGGSGGGGSSGGTGAATTPIISGAWGVLPPTTCAYPMGRCTRTSP